MLDGQRNSDPDWLLLEIQNQILIRPVQIDIAREIIKAESGVVLADMGIGKSSTILPMVVTALATGSSLVRVIVLKPLANEMLRILSRSLSGLVGRAVYFLPISRQTTLTETTLSIFGTSMKLAAKALAFLSVCQNI